VGVAIVAMLASGARGGPLDPPGPPAATLPQVEPRMPIPPVGWDGVSAITISSSGSYFLTRNLTQIPIGIAAENVTFDLDGFTLSGGPGQNGITVASGTKRNIVIRNGTLVGTGNTDNNGRGIYAPDAGRSTFSDLHTSGWGAGLWIGTGNTVLRVDSHDNVTAGIFVQQGIDFGGSIEDSNFSKNGTGIELLGDDVDVRNSIMNANVAQGIFISAKWSEVSESRMTDNQGYGAYILGFHNVLVRNHVDGNATAPFLDSGSGSIIGPISPATSMNPEENIGS
jgi:hypothetical protein